MASAMCRRLEFKWGLHKEASKWPSPVLGSGHFEYRTDMRWQKVKMVWMCTMTGIIQRHVYEKVVIWTANDITRERSVWVLRFSQWFSKQLLSFNPNDPWQWQQYAPLTGQKALTQRHSVTSWKTRILKNILSFLTTFTDCLPNNCCT
jgi:hypothetical protein